MLFSNTIAMVLAVAPATLFAAPTPSQALDFPNLVARSFLDPNQVKKLEDGACDLDSAAMPTAPTPLPAPATGLKLSHVAIGRGTQNYTCAANPNTSTAPKAVGAIATLFNATCQAVRAPAVLADVTALALNYQIPSSQIADIMQSGHHEFTEKGVPLFKLVTDKVNFGYVQAKPAANSTAPTTAVKGTNGLGTVAWLKLDAVEGDYKSVFRINTAGGTAPKTCEGLEGDFTVPYSAEYWFYK